ncbi:hypothetical protein H4R99_001201 [Coemansia sp. RSA 1722]|nr:hypothetical protein LPJ57_000513 [Coemansia sp. RSA 486]KAJ2237243.1 hypothetical protein IWW45_001118 [Coemansia sp. RSA 485]KAJ2601408.1 hypothetical protein GGF39_001255 [Coemansia sp. RSA 1721]KAJ2605342.1 hypothetical protein H4R99_001201 [Coemansia sp. RSA 1722]KAJ2638787.1 hypothetical protein GGF40_001385 [Coemansia sp. RSA 1286]
MKSLGRCVHAAKLAQNRIISNGDIYDKYHTLGVPDIMLNASTCFKHSATSVASSSLLGTKYLNDVPPQLTYQLVSLATRPLIVKALRLRILSMGQGKKLGDNLRFNQLKHVQFDDKAARKHLKIQFIEPSIDHHNKLSSKVGDPASIVDPFIITGPRHIGKSHIMFNLAARMAADPGVVVMYISNASDLLVRKKDDKQRMFTQFVEYIACAFCEYDEINNVVSKWYAATEMGHAENKMPGATRVFLQNVHELCKNYQGNGHQSKRQKGITPIIFIDRYELLANANPSDCIVTVMDLAYTYGFQVVLSTSDPVSYRMQPQSYIVQCVISTPLSVKEARGLAVAVAGQLKISKQEMNRILHAADYHPIDIAGILQNCMKYTTLTPEIVKDNIYEYRFHRQERLAAMHADFMRKVLDVNLGALEINQIRTVCAARKIIDSDIPKLVCKHREILRTIFMLYHRIDFCPGTIYDPNFVIKDPSNERKKAHNNGIRCMPYAAIQAMYEYHFGHSVEEQFSWLLNQAVYHHDINQSIRSRYFDLLLLEVEQLNLTLTNPLNNYEWTETLNFRAMTSHTYFNIDEDYGDPEDCMYFTDAVNYVANYIALDKEIRPSPHRIPVLCMSLLIYFPNLTFLNKPQTDSHTEDNWIDQELSANTSFSGTFMACVTRYNDFSNNAYQGCEYDVLWIACDPLTAVSSSEIVRSNAINRVYKNVQLQTAIRQAEHQRMELEKHISSKDMSDYDADFGFAESWSAKAFRVFPALRKRCIDKIPNKLLKSVKMLALAETKRAAGILEEKQLVSKTAELAEFANKGSTDIGLMSMDKLPYYKTIQQYFM